MLCLCGCGQETSVADWTNEHHRNGEHRKYIKGHYAKHMSAISGPKYTVLDDGCWEWTAGKSHGYGVIRVGDKVKRAHVKMWEDANGPKPQGVDLHHRCGRKSCVNPDHLEVLTRSEHVKRHLQK